MQIYFLSQTTNDLDLLVGELRDSGVNNFEQLIDNSFAISIQKIIDTSKADYALFINANTYVPWNINKRVDTCIAKANEEFGEYGWAMIGNKGINFFSESCECYLSEPLNRQIPTGNLYPHPAYYVDNHVFLLNLKNLRDKKVNIGRFKTNYYIGFFILLEAAKSGLVSAIDSTLYARVRERINISSKDKRELSEYFGNNFLNDSIRTTTGIVSSANKRYGYLIPGKNDMRTDLDELLRGNLKRIYIEKQVELNIIIRTTLRNIFQIRRLLDTIRIGQGSKENMKINVHLGINNCKNPDLKDILKQALKEYEDLNIICHDILEFGERRPRVGVLAAIVAKLETSKESFVWVVDDDDFVMLDVFRYGNIILHEGTVTLGDSVVFEEDWDESNDSFPSKTSEKLRYFAKNYYGLLQGDNTIPVCSAIYPVKIFKQIMEEWELLGDYCEDYVILLIASKYADIQPTNMIFAGISHHGSNTVLESKQTHWDYSYATFFSEISNQRFFSRLITEYIKNNSGFNGAEKIQFEIFEREMVYFVWKILKKFKIRKVHIQPIINTLAAISRFTKKFSKGR